MWIRREISKIMVHHPFFSIIASSKIKRHPPHPTNHTMISNKVRLLFSNKRSKPYCINYIKQTYSYSKKLFIFSPPSFWTGISKEFNLIPFLFKDSFYIMNICFNTSYFIYKIAYHNNFFTLQIRG